VAELEFNGERIEAKQGDSLLGAARRRGAHVWFLCDGRGICQTCECRVVSGSEHLGKLSEIERTGLSENRRREGYRLGCQTTLLGTGPVSVVSRAEELRRRARDLVLGSKGRSLWQRVEDLGGDSLRATVDLLAGVTRSAPNVIPQIVKCPLTPARVADYARDSLRLAGRLLGIG